MSLLGFALVGLCLLPLGRQGLVPLQERLLLFALSPRDLFAERLLLSAKRLELRDRGAPALVGGQGLVNDTGGEPALGLGSTEPVGVVAERLRIDHPASLSATQRRTHRCFSGPRERQIRLKSSR